MSDLPPEFLVGLGQVFGAAGRRFATELPTLLVRCEQRFAITVGPPYELSINYVCRARRADGSSCVLKLAPLHEENTLVAEAAFLRRVAGDGAVRLFEDDPSLGALLLEAVQPGTALTRLVLDGHDEMATQVGASTMRALWRPPPPGQVFPSISDEAQAFDRHRSVYGRGGPIPYAAIDAAEQLYRDLSSSQAAPVLLHGDLHHDNILAADESRAAGHWLAIDPKGLLGEPAYEVGAFLRNPWQLLDLPDPPRLIARRVQQLAEQLALPEDRVLGWGYAINVLSAVWDVDDPATVQPGDGHWPLTCAELIAATGSL